MEENIKKIVSDGDVDKMYKLADLLEDSIDKLAEYDKECADKYEMKIYIMANGKTLNREMAEEIVHKMRPYGMKWSYEEVKDLQEQYGIDDIRVADFFVVINSAYNDYKNLFGEDIDQYIKFTIDFIKDEDAKEGKVFLYFM